MTSLSYGFDVDGFCWGIDVGGVIKNRQKRIGSEAQNVHENDDGEKNCDAVTTLTYRQNTLGEGREGEEAGVVDGKGPRSFLYSQ